MNDRFKKARARLAARLPPTRERPPFSMKIFFPAGDGYDWVEVEKEKVIETIKKLFKDKYYSSLLDVIKNGRKNLPGCREEEELTQFFNEYEKKCQGKIPIKITSSESPVIEKKLISPVTMLDVFDEDNAKTTTERIANRNKMLVHMELKELSFVIPNFKRLVDGIKSSYGEKIKQPGRCLPVNQHNQYELIINYYQMCYLKNSKFFEGCREKFIPIPQKNINLSMKVLCAKLGAISSLYKLFVTKNSLSDWADIVLDAAMVIYNAHQAMPGVFLYPLAEIHSLICSVLNALIDFKDKDQFMRYFLFFYSHADRRDVPDSVKDYVNHTFLRAYEYFTEIIFKQKNCVLISHHITEGIYMIESYKTESKEIKQSLDILKNRLLYPKEEWVRRKLISKNAAPLFSSNLGEYPLLEEKEREYNEDILRNSLNNEQIKHVARLEEGLNEIFQPLVAQENLDEAIALATTKGLDNTIFNEVLLTFLELKIIIGKQDLPALTLFEKRYVDLSVEMAPTKKMPSTVPKKFPYTIDPVDAERKRRERKAAHEASVAFAEQRKLEEKKKAKTPPPTEAAVWATPVPSPSKKAPNKKKKRITRRKKTRPDDTKEESVVDSIEVKPVRVSNNFVRSLFARHSKKTMVAEPPIFTFRDFFSPLLTVEARVSFLTVLRALPTIEEKGIHYYTMRFKGSTIVAALLRQSYGMGRELKIQVGDVDIRTECNDFALNWVRRNMFTLKDYSHRQGYINYFRNFSKDEKDGVIQCFVSLEMPKVKMRVSGKNHIPFASLEAAMDREERIHIIGLTPEIAADLEARIFRIILPDLEKNLALTTCNYLLRVMKYYHYFVLLEEFSAEEKSTQVIFEHGWARRFLGVAAEQNINNFYNEISRLLQWEIAWLKSLSRAHYDEFSILSIRLLEPFLNAFFGIILEKLSMEEKIHMTPVILTTRTLKWITNLRDNEVKREPSPNSGPLSSNEWLATLCDHLKEAGETGSHVLDAMKRLILASDLRYHTKLRFFEAPVTTTPVVTATTASTPTMTI